MKFSYTKLFSAGTLVLLFLSVASMRAAYAVSCNTPSATSGNLLISGDCAFARTVDGPDTSGGGEASQTNSSKLLLHTGVLTIGGTQTIALGSILATGSGSIAIANGGKIYPGRGIWVADADGDGWGAGTYPSPVSTFYTATASGRRRLSLMKSHTSDCNDNAFSASNTCYSAFYPSFYPAFYPAFYPSFGPYGGFSPYGGFYPQFSP
jgi:hypothetical protein